MKKGWQTKPFEECIEKVMYTAKVRRKDFLADGTYPIVSQEDEFINGYWDNEADVFKITTPIVVFGDHTKALKYVDFDFVLGADGVKVLQPQGFLLPKFFFYHLQTANLDSLGYARHYKLLKELRLTYPPLPEQRRIVGILDEAFESIATAKANAEKNLQNARALFESHLQSVFTQRGPGWVEKRLCEVATSISTGPFGTMLHKSDYVLDGIPLVNPMNIVGSTIVPSSKMMVNAGTRDRLSGYVLKVGDVVVGRRGELGRCALVTEREAGWLCGTGSFFIRLSDAMDGEFFVALFGSEQFKARLETSAVGTTMSSLNHGILNDLVLPVPPLVEQRIIMEKAQALLAETQRLESLYERKLAALEALKKSLLHQAFTGAM